MTRARITGGALAAVLVVVGVAASYRARGREAPPVTSPAATSSPPAPAKGEEFQGFLYGRVTTGGGESYEGRLRWGGGQEAFWGDYFNGTKVENPWIDHMPAELQARARQRPKFLGFEVPRRVFGILVVREQPAEFRRRFMARFGDIARIEPSHPKEVRITLKSGAVSVLDRFDASDFDDGVRVWDRTRGVVDIDSLRIAAIDLLPTSGIEGAPGRLHGTVRTPRGEFTGFVQWNREECVGSDELVERNAEGEVRLRFDAIRAIARRSRDSAAVTLGDGREVVLSGREVGENRGLYVDDRRYGRVLVSWDAFERVDFGTGGSGPAYDEFPKGRPLRGAVTTRAGRRIAGRLVYDLDESEITETLDAPAQGVDYTIPFGLIASIVLPGEPGGGAPRVKLHTGEELPLERSGDLGDRNGGVLIFVEGRPRPEYVAWGAIAQIEFERPEAMYPPLQGG